MSKNNIKTKEEYLELFDISEKNFTRRQVEDLNRDVEKSSDRVDVVKGRVADRAAKKSAKREMERAMKDSAKY